MDDVPAVAAPVATDQAAERGRHGLTRERAPRRSPARELVHDRRQHERGERVRDEPGDRAARAERDQRAAAGLGDVADVLRIAVEIGEEHLDGADVAELAGGHDLLRPHPLRVVTDHEGLGDHHAGRHTPQLLGFGGIEGDRLLAEHMLAGFQRLDRPGHMQVVGQRVVDRLDGGVGQQRLVAPIRLRYAGRPRGGLRRGQGARGDGTQLDQRAGQHRRDHVLQPDLRGAQHAPHNRFHGVLHMAIQSIMDPLIKSASLRRHEEKWECLKAVLRW